MAGSGHVMVGVEFNPESLTVTSFEIAALDMLTLASSVELTFICIYLVAN